MKSDKEQRKQELLRILQNVSREQQPPCNDQEIIAQCQSKDKTTSRAAFTQLIQRYQNNVYTYISQMMQDEQTACDTTRDTFVQAYRHMTQIQTDQSVKPWLLKIAKNQMLKASRKQEKWYLALLPLSLYHWYQQKTERDEETQETAQAKNTECQDIRSLLSAYIDDELISEEMDRVENHLATCPHCAQEYDELLKVVDMIQPFDLIPAPANLQREIYAVLDKETLWERCTNYYEKFAGIFRFPVPQIAVAVASIVIIFLGIAYYSQHEQIRQMEVELRALRGRGITLTEEMSPTTFVIFTGKIVSEGMPPEAGEYVSKLIPEPDKAEMWFIAGNITDTGDKITEYIRSIQGKITADQGFTHNSLTIRKITTGLPKHSNLIVSLFFQQLEQKPPGVGDPSNKSKISIEIYIIDKL